MEWATRWTRGAPLFSLSLLTSRSRSSAASSRRNFLGLVPQVLAETS